MHLNKDLMFFRFALYGFLKNLRFFEPFIMLIFRDSGLSFLEIGLLYAVREITTNVLEIPSGVYADAFGRRRSMLLAFVSYIVSFIVFFAFSGFYIYALAMACFAVGEALRSGTHKALILEHLKLNRMEGLKVAYYGRTRAASQLGSAANALIAVALLFFAGHYRFMFIASVLPYALNLINLASYPKALDGTPIKLQKGEMLAQIKNTLKSFFSIFTDPYTLRAILNSAGFTAFFQASKDYLQPILRTFAISLPLFVALGDDKRAAILIGMVYFIMYLISSFASKSASGFSQRFGKPALAINATFYLGAVFLFVAGLTAWLKLTPLAILAFLGLYIVQNLRRPMNVAFISDQIESKVMASGFSVESQAVTALLAILAPILGVLADHAGVGAALASLGAGLLLSSLFVTVRTRV